ncbi:MAG TPA: 7-cyano-7-deazaguanine synthase QueC [Mariprofundaceae bacterium]|nr:7-cyano-7-deazaguanine synthase QueC [Mariprofundaceae bacterium]
MTRAVVLLSGGLDSSTALAWAVREQGWQCVTIAFDYGQRHRMELEASKRVANALDVTDHRVIHVNLDTIGGSALTSKEIEVPKDQPKTEAIPVTYVPARNLIFLSIAAGLAESVGASRLVIGANIMDYSGYPDCRPEFLNAFEETLRLGSKAGIEGDPIRISAPLIRMKKSEIIELGLKLGLDYGLTHSCYDPLPDGSPCGHCDSCHYRRLGFGELRREDPLHYSD